MLATAGTPETAGRQQHRKASNSRDIRNRRGASNSRDHRDIKRASEKTWSTATSETHAIEGILNNKKANNIRDSNRGTSAAAGMPTYSYLNASNT